MTESGTATTAVAEPQGVERLERELELVAAAIVPGPLPGGDEQLHPRPISAAELTRRMRPFLVWN